ncbi:hypothetical protein PFISCL1PPCAC_12572, partial [Pristionchus fissidentatus]
KGATVFLALGDLQTTMYACRMEKSKIVLNLGTSSQFAFCPDSVSGLDPAILNRPHCRVDPYFNNDELVVCASMNGGNMVEDVIK